MLFLKALKGLIIMVYQIYKDYEKCQKALDRFVLKTISDTTISEHEACFHK